MHHWSLGFRLKPFLAHAGEERVGVVPAFVWTLGGWVVGDGRHVEVPSGWIQVIRGPRPGCSHGSATKDSAAAGVRQSAAQSVQKSKVGGIPAVRERKTPDTIRQEASTRVSRLQAGINSLGDGDCGSQEGIGVVSCQSTEAGGGPTHAPDRRNSRVHRKGQEENSPRRREDPSCRASRGRSQGGEGVRFARTPVGRVPFRASAGRGTSPCIVPCSPTPVRLGSSDLISDATGEPASSRERLIRADVDTTARCLRGGDASEEIPPRGFRAWLCGRVGRVDGLSSTGNERRSCFREIPMRLGFGGRSNAVATVDPTPVCCDEHGPLSVRRHQNSRMVHARYGLRGVLVGEANNPGPRRQCRHHFESSSEDEFLVRPIEGRDVIPRMEPRIEPDSNRFAALADAETVPAGTQELEEVRDIREWSSHDRVPETIVDALEEDLGWRDRQVPGPRRRQRIRGEGSDLGPVHDLTLIDSSDDDATFVVPRRSAASVERGPETEGESQAAFSQAENIQPMRRLGRRLVLVPQSTGTPRSVQDRSYFTATVVDESTVGIHNDSPERRLVDAFEFYLTKCDSSSEDSLSDTASCTQFVPRRRLSLVWNVERSEPQAERIEERPVQWGARDESCVGVDS